MVRPSEKTLRGGNIRRSVKPGDWATLKNTERAMEAEERETMRDNPNEFIGVLRDPETGEEAYTEKQQKRDLLGDVRFRDGGVVRHDNKSYRRIR